MIYRDEVVIKDLDLTM